MNNKLSMLETWLTIFWFAMDACWMSDLVPFAYWLIIPNIILLIVYGIKMERTLINWISHIVGTSWFAMNSFWMLSEKYPSMKIYATIFMILGIISIIVTLLTGNSDALIKRFRLRKN